MTSQTGSETYGYDADGAFENGSYHVEPADLREFGFDYVFPSGVDNPQRINVAFYVVGDIDCTGRSKGGIDEIWDALRINEPGAPKIGSNNLEICIDNGMNTNIFSNPIDVVYIPMSRMLWKDLL